jgi:hypothetical protein
MALLLPYGSLANTNDPLLVTSHVLPYESYKALSLISIRDTILALTSLIHTAPPLDSIIYNKSREEQDIESEERGHFSSLLFIAHLSNLIIRGRTHATMALQDNWQSLGPWDGRSNHEHLSRKYKGSNKNI